MAAATVLERWGYSTLILDWTESAPDNNKLARELALEACSHIWLFGSVGSVKAVSNAIKPLLTGLGRDVPLYEHELSENTRGKARSSNQDIHHGAEISEYVDQELAKGGPK